jgi:type IV pilus assembly protein PilA
MRKNNRKGFTIVELVIVIAVIAILAGVLIPTFSGIITKAQESAEVQKVSAAYKEAYALELAEGKGEFTTAKTETVGDYTFTWTVDTDNEITAVDVTGSTGFTVTYSDGAFTAVKS